MLKHLLVLVFLSIGLASSLTYAETSTGQENPITAIDILLEADQTMLQRAEAANARLLKAYPKGFALDAAHRPHITMLQRYVQTADLDKAYAAIGNVLAATKAAGWKLKAFKYYYIPSNEIGLAGIVAEPTEDLLKLQQALIDAVAPFAAPAGTAAAFVSNDGGRDIQQALIQYVADFVPASSGKNFSPHVTVGVATQDYLKGMLAEEFVPFTFSPAGAAVYQLGSFGTAQKKLRSWELTP